MLSDHKYSSDRLTLFTQLNGVPQRPATNLDYYLTREIVPLLLN
jgi:hypothetical protein